VWRQADKYGVPRICFVNKMGPDRRELRPLRRHDHRSPRAKPMVLHLPIGVESDFVGMVDLVQMKSITWKDEALGAEFTVGDIPDDMKKACRGISPHPGRDGRRARR